MILGGGAGAMPQATPAGASPFPFIEVASDPSVSPGRAAPVGTRAFLADGTAAWDKFGPADTDWSPVGSGGGGSADQTAWFVDPVDGSDDADGLTNANAIKTLAELARRWAGALIKTNATATLLGNVPSTDVPNWTFTLAPDVTFTIAGSIGPTTGFGGRPVDNTLYTGTLSSVQAAPTAPTTNDTHISDAGIPVSYTASGLMAPGVLFKRTNSTESDFWGLKDLGSKTLRITPPANAVGTPAALAPGNTYSAYQLWSVPSMDFGAQGAGVIFESLYDLGTANELFAIGAPQLNRTWSTRLRLRIVHVINSLLTNPNNNACQLSPLFAVPAQIVGGGFLGAGTALSVSVFGTIGITQQWACQNATFAPNDASYISLEGPGGFYDCTAPWFLQIDGSRVACNQSTAAVGISGSGNTSKFVNITAASQFYYGVNGAAPPFVAGSTSDASPIEIDSNSFALSLLPTTEETVLRSGAFYPGGGSLQVQTFTTPEVDLTATSSNVVAPAVAGKSFTLVRAVAHVTQVAGSITTAPTVNVGNTASHNNQASASTTFPGTAAFAGGAPFDSSFSPAPQASSPQNAAMFVDITAAATGTGGFVFKAKFQLTGYYS